MFEFLANINSAQDAANAAGFVILAPVLAGLILFLVPDRHRIVALALSLITSALTAYTSLLIFRSDLQNSTPDGLTFLKSLPGGLPDLLDAGNGIFNLHIDNLNRLIILFISLFAVIILPYSAGTARTAKVSYFYSWFMITLGCAYGAALSDNLLLFLFFWGILGLTLYKLIRGKDEASSAAAKKTLILIGASDSIMIIGIAILWKICGTLNMSEIHVNATGPAAVFAFIALITGSFTKAGAFPFHTWVPDYCEHAAADSSAYLPASLDKLLGIYFLARITTQLFEPLEWMKLILLITGVITIIAAVMMALMQHDIRRLLGYHAVSQVGYMILGFGLGSIMGVAGGLFHMLNNAIYKSGLFLASGSVIYRTGKTEIGGYGGLSASMPISFICTLIFAFSISGIPPLNGFASKWIIYQGIIDSGLNSGIAAKLWIVWLSLAVLGSALTLASFIKLIGGVFLGRKSVEFDGIREVPAYMWIPQALLALLCIGLGTFAAGLVIPKLLMPVSGSFKLIGFWDSSLVSLLVLVSIIAGILIYLLPGLKNLRAAESFIGGEKLQDQSTYSTTEFYKTLTEFRFVDSLYKRASEKWFDVYDLSKRFVLWLSHSLSEAHTGILPAYVIWIFAGLVIMLLIMI